VRIGGKSAMAVGGGIWIKVNGLQQNAYTALLSFLSVFVR